jgi:TolB-like protein
MDHQTFQSAQFHDGLTKEDVLSQLSRILSSLLFRESPTVSRFLNYVVQEVLSGENRCIKQYTIAVDALGYSKNFDPHTSNSVRVLAGRLRLMLELYYLNEGTHDKIRISIPKRTYIPTFDTIVWPQAETQSVSPAAQTPVSTPNYGLSIAVIPFSVSSVRKDFANDITDSIVIGLSHYHQMQIVGPLEEYKNATINADRIAQKYRVRFVFQGRIKKYGQALRVNAFLTDALTGFKIWTQTHEYSETANLNDIEDDVSRQIVNALASFSSCLISRES